MQEGRDAWSLSSCCNVAVTQEGRDAWDYALKYARRSCQRVLRECADDTTVHETDNDHDKYVSIFRKFFLKISINSSTVVY